MAILYFSAILRFDLVLMAAADDAIPTFRRRSLSFHLLMHLRPSQNLRTTKLHYLLLLAATTSRALEGLGGFFGLSSHRSCALLHQLKCSKL